MQQFEMIQVDHRSPLLLSSALTAISYTVLIYEYLLTFHQEVESFWPNRARKLLIGHDDAASASGRFTWTSFFFFANRYITLFGHIPVMLQYFWRTKSGDVTDLKICHHLQVYHQWLAIFLQCLAGSYMTLRTYALYGRQKWVLVLLGGTGILCVGLGAWSIVADGKNIRSPLVHVPNGCGNTLTVRSARVLVAPWSGEVVFNVFVFAMTLWKALTLPKGRGLGILTVIIQDGSLYFAVMVFLNVGNILLFLLADPFSRGSATPLVNVISSLLISRLIFHLRDPKWQNNERFSATTTGFGRLSHRLSRISHVTSSAA